ncbi:MAG: hypothetical protein Q4E60_07980 [Bacteroidales bacterium]|nr:hypothetical protein [Bacteroidales bacterium]
MKKIYTLMIAAVAAFGFTSCSNNEVDEVIEQKQEMKLNISVADLDLNAATRAVKTGWEAGDKINIWFKGNMQQNPDLVIKYDGTKWDKDTSATLSGNEPAASGEIVYFYEGRNDLSSYSVILQSTQTVFNSDRKMGLLYSGTVSYTYTAGTLTFNMDNWKPLMEFQVVVTGIDPSNYQLKCNNLMLSNTMSVNATQIVRGNYTYDEYTNGVSNADGAAFYFGYAQDVTASATYNFTLKNKTTGVEYHYSVTGKAHTRGTFQGIKIDKAKFGL